MPDLSDLINDFNALKARVDAIETTLANLEPEATKLAGEVSTLTSTVSGLNTGLTALQNAAEAMVDPETGIRAKDILALRALTDSKLKVRIISYQGYALDNYYGKYDDGDGDRTVQFQKDNPSNQALDMTLKIVR